MNNDFVDELERELRAASSRRLKLALARVPRAPAGIATALLSLAICAAVAVPLLQARSRPAGGGSEAGNGALKTGSVVRTCADTVGGQLARDWHTPRHGTVIAGPITWLYLLIHPGQDGRKYHFIQGFAVVNPG